MKKKLLFIRRLLIGPVHRKIKIEKIYIGRLKELCLEPTFGILRIVRFLWLSLNIVFFITLLGRFFLNKKPLIYKKLFVDALIFIKLIIPIIIINYANAFSLSGILSIGVAIYIICSTVYYSFSDIILRGSGLAPINNDRSLLIILLSYFEVNFCYAILYKGIGCIPGVYCNIQALYFSFVCGATVGFGDYYPDNDLGRIIVITQIIIMVLFVSLLISSFLSKLGSRDK
jgi:hypothetical protein